MEEVTFRSDGVRISRKDFTVHDVQFALRTGDILGLVGRSGSGKSTIIHGIIGDLPLDTGRVTLTVDGAPKRLAHNLGYSPQDHALYTNLSIEENCLLFGSLQGMHHGHIEEQMRRFLPQLRLTHARSKRIHQLSGGMRKRADLLVSIIHDPRVLVLDEPFSGLDIALTEFLWEFLMQLAAEGRIIVLTTHNLDDAEEHCTHYGLVRNGQYHDTEELLKRVGNDRRRLSTYLRTLFEQDATEEIRE